MNGRELEVPETAVAAFRRLCSQVVPLDELKWAGRVRAVAAPVVAAELRRIADAHQRVSDSYTLSDEVAAPADLRVKAAHQATARSLRARADELDKVVS